MYLLCIHNVCGFINGPWEPKSPNMANFYDRFAYSLVIVIELLGHAIMDYYRGLERESLSHTVTVSPSYQNPPYRP